MNETTNLTGSEKMALVRKFKTNSFRAISETTKLALVKKGLIEAGTMRLTENGLAEVEAIIRS